MRVVALIAVLATVVQLAGRYTWAQKPDAGTPLEARARYVAGYPNFPREKKGGSKGARGYLYLEKDSLRFTFCSEKEPPGAGPKQAREAVSSEVTKPWCQRLRCGEKRCLEEDIPYGKIKLLARGKVTSTPISGHTSLITTWISIVTLMGSITTSGTARNWLIGSSVGAGMLLFVSYVRSHRRGNYISIFFCPPTGQCHGNPSSAVNPVAQSANLPVTKPASATAGPPAGKGPNASASNDGDNLFKGAKGCHVAIFKIPSAHDYWNISMILNATTGLEFVSQGAERK